jgi:hypothetical protein
VVSATEKQSKQHGHTEPRVDAQHFSPLSRYASRECIPPSEEGKPTAKGGRCGGRESPLRADPPSLPKPQRSRGTKPPRRGRRPAAATLLRRVHKYKALLGRGSPGCRGGLRRTGLGSRGENRSDRRWRSVIGPRFSMESAAVALRRRLSRAGCEGGAEAASSLVGDALKISLGGFRYGS